MLPTGFISIRRLAAFAAIALVAPLAVATPAASVTGSGSSVFINEIHYDNTGTDAGEAIEVAAPAGTDLTGWSLVLYNGNGGAPYDTDAFPAVPVPDDSNGWGFVTINYAVNGIQNGSPDGVALVNGSTVVQFLSYEGTFAAVGGPANGQTSTDIGASEAGTEPIGQSLQLSGAGDTAGEFTWQGPATSTFGAANTGQTFGSFDSAPRVTSTSPTDGATDVAADSTLTVTFSEDVTLTAGAITLSCGGTDQPVTVSGGPSSYTVDPDSNLPVGATCTGAVTAAAVSDADTDDPPDHPSEDFAWSFATGGSCGDGATPIHDVQGSGSASPMAGQPVVVEAVVTADRTGTSRLRGYNVQEESTDADGSAATSEGVFVFGSLPSGAAEGDLVRVTGEVQEFGNQTEIGQTSAQLCDAQPDAPPATAVTFPLQAVSDLESFEGMVVTFPQDLMISEYFNYDRFNETVVGVPPNGRTRFDTPTAVVEPGPAAQAMAAEYPLRQIILDDARETQNPSPPYFPGTVDTPFTLAKKFRGGDTLTGVTGVLAEAHGTYRVHPTANATHNAVNPRTAAPPAVGGKLRVASFNVLNYFLTLEGGSTQGTCGPNRDQDCRGANTEEERLRQRAKIVDAISRLNADIVGLMEMENTTGVEPAADIVAGLNAKMGAGTYAYIDTGVIGTDAIRVGMLYKPARVKANGHFAILDHTVDPRFLDTKNRPSLAQTFVQVGTGGRLTVAVNHLKSKGSDCNDVNDPDLGDGQGNCNLTRTAAATALADWLRSDPTDSDDPDSLIIGDLNSYDHEDPIDALAAGGYTDMIKQFGGEFAYSYVFDGQVGYLDHGLASPTLAGQVTGAADWHINADEPDILDYDMTFKKDAEDLLYEPNAYRASDHDPVLIGLNLKPGKS